MSGDISELLRTTAPAPTADVDLDALTVRLRRRRQHRMVTRLVAGAVVLAAGGSITLMAQRDTAPDIATPVSTSSDEPHTITVEAETGSLAITAPPGWHALPPGGNPGPVEQLTIASVSTRPTSGVITACVGEPLVGRAAYVSIYEYGRGDPLVLPTEGDGGFAPSSFQPRPPHFDPASWLGGECAPPNGAVGSHFRMLPFAEGGRRFLIRVVTAGDPDGELLASTGPILDTLQVEDLRA